LHSLELQPYKGIFNIYETLVKNLTLQIKKIEQMIMAVIESNKQIGENYQLCGSDEICSLDK